MVCKIRVSTPRPTAIYFVVESHENRIKEVLRDTKSNGKPDVVEIFAEHGLNKPFGIAFYPPGNELPIFIRRQY